jgi:hypothetical protein
VATGLIANIFSHDPVVAVVVGLVAALLFTAAGVLIVKHPLLGTIAYVAIAVAILLLALVTHTAHQDREWFVKRTTRQWFVMVGGLLVVVIVPVLAVWAHTLRPDKKKGVALRG